MHTQLFPLAGGLETVHRKSSGTPQGQARTPPASTMTERTPPAERTLPATNEERALRTRDPRSGGCGGCGGRPGQRVEEQGTWASRTRKRSKAGGGRPADGGVGTAKTVKRPPQQPTQPPIRQLLGAADVQTAHPATSSTAPAHHRQGSANAETTRAGAPAAAADRTQRPDATCEGNNG